MSFSKDSYAGNSKASNKNNCCNPKKESLLASSSNPLNPDCLNNGSTSRNATVEDQLKRDCSFFYQEMEEDGRKLKFNTAKQQQRQQQRLSSTSSLAAISRRRVMSSRDSSNFMNRYEQLNQEIAFDSEEDDDNDIDFEQFRNIDNSLLLDEQVEFGSSSYHHQQNLGPTNNVVTDGLKTSSLFYEQDGRVLMRLPRDMVKLIMDHDLEPGILSVEQWRKREDVERQELEAQKLQEDLEEMPVDPLMSKGGGQRPEIAASSPSSLGLSDLPELHYVMTVPDDLYQRVVSEISREVFPPYWGFFKCCNHESDRADIKLALAILSVVLFLLMIGSIEWPTN
jgi:hypothetical protein